MDTTPRTAKVSAQLLDRSGYPVLFFVEATADAVLSVRREGASQASLAARREFFDLLDGDVEETFWATVDAALDCGHPIGFAVIAEAA